MSLDFGFGTPFFAQIEHLRRKLSLPTERWDDIEREAHDRAFIVAGAAKADLLQDLHEAVNAAVAGGGLADFRRQFRHIVAKHGWTGWTGEGSAAGEAWRVRTIYQTNLATSYAAGRWRQMTEPGFAALMPFWRYRHADGVLHPRPLHLAWDGLTLPQTHRFWKTHFAPNGFGCGCKIFAVAAPAPGAPTEPPAGWDRINPATGAPVGIDKGFDYAPGASTAMPWRQVVQDKLITYPPAIAQALTADVNRTVAASADVPEWVRTALRDPSVVEPLWLGFVSNVEAVSAVAGADVQGYMITVAGDVPRHARNAHEYDGAGQRAAQPEDFGQIARVLNEADALRDGGEARDGGASVIATKKIDGETFRAVFAVLTGKRTRSLALRSLVIKTGR